MVNLSIIVPMYNVEEYIEKCLKSILEQNIPKDEYEIILLNDGSTDNTMCIAERYAKAHSEIRLFQHSNMGLSATRNRGIQLAVGEYIYFMDSDDYLIPESLAIIYNALIDKNILQASYRAISSKQCLKENEPKQCVKCDGIREYDRGVQNKQTKPAIIGFKNLAGSMGEKHFQDIIVRNRKQISDWRVYSGNDFIATHDYLDMVWWYFIERDYLLNLEVTFAEGQTMEDAAFTAAVLLKATNILVSDVQVYYYVYNPQSITRTKSRDRHLSTLNGKICSALRIQSLITSNNIPKETRNRLIARRNGIVFDALIKIIRCYGFSEAKATLVYLRRHEIYPVKGTIRGIDNRSIKLLKYIFNSGLLLSTISQLYRVISKLRSITFRNL